MKKAKTNIQWKIRRYQSVDWVPVCRLIQKVIQEFLSREQSEAATTIMIKRFSPSNQELYRVFGKKPAQVWVAVKNKKIIGIIRGSFTRRIQSLYVDGRYQKQGIGRALIAQFEKTARQQGYACIKVYAALSAESFYTRVGFVKSTGKRSRKKDGLRYQPMKKILI